MNDSAMIPNIPESMWAVISDKLQASRWEPDAKPESRMDALISYCNWYFDTFGVPEI